MIGLDTPLGSRPTLEDSRDPGLSFLLDIVSAQGSSATGPTAAERERLLALAAAWRQPSASPPDLFGRKSACSPPEWHLRRLLECADALDRPEGEADPARRLYHARWLGHLLVPDCVEFRPPVTVLIPVYNRVSLAVEAVESCLAQTWRPLEILVIDDGSTDDLGGALGRFGDAVRVERQPNRGVSSARNAGIRLARGDFIHFLDSDNLLLPAAVARKVDAFARFPDAELCYSLAEIEGERQQNLPRTITPDGSARCPTVDLLAAGPRHPFYVSCVMLPRFTLMASGGFEEDLRRGEDTRLWVKLALRDAKVIGLNAKLTIRRLSGSSLSGAPMPRSLQLVTTARTIADFLGNQRAWTLAARSFPGLLHIALQDDDGSAHPGVPGSISDLLAAIGSLGADFRRADASPLPLLAYLRHLTRRALDSSGGTADDRAALLTRICAAIDAAASGAARLTRSDISFWGNPAVTRIKKHRLASFFARAEALVAEDASALPFVDELLRSAPTIPARRTFDNYMRLRLRKMPRRIALWWAVRKEGQKPTR